MQRFYFPDLENSTDSVTIKNMNLINQLIKVLRVTEGYELIFFNWEDHTDYVFKIISLDKREIYLEKQWTLENDSEIDFDLTLFQALPNKLDKMEQIVAKWVEVWVTGFYFFRSERSQKLHLSENKIDRLEKIIEEACEQSGRSRIPELIIEENLSLEDIAGCENIFFHTADTHSQSLSDLKLKKDNWVNLFVGPEWWFSEEEIETFTTSWFMRVHLGDRILRTETTWVVTAFSIIQN